MKIVCLEGCSGVGKTTQFHKLNEYYKHKDIEHLSIVEKNYPPFRDAVKYWHENKGPGRPFTKEDIIMFADARAKTFEKNFKKLEGKTDLLILDGYYHTSAVYQRNEKISSKEIIQINLEYGAPKPDLVLLLDCPPNKSFNRSEARNFRTGGKHLFSKSPEKIAEIRREYLKLTENFPEIVRINTNRPRNEVYTDLVEKINNLFY